MNKQEAIQELEEIADEFAGDPEAAHMNADQTLCDLLDSLGYGEVVEAWRRVDKWYA